MALHSFAVVVVVVALVSCLLAPPAVEASSINISTYWGTDARDGDHLKNACNASLYSIVNIGFVDRFRYDWPPRLNIQQCNASEGKCKYLGPEIEECQKNGVKVLISIGGPGGDYDLPSSGYAKMLAEYLWNAYLGGNKSSVDRPFGDAILNGVDFFIQAGSGLHWDVLAKALTILSYGTQMELSATPKCKYPDKYLDAAIQTGLFDYAQVRFYDEVDCQYNGSFDGMITAWDEWAVEAKVDKIFGGVTANENDPGYVDPNLLVNGPFLQHIKTSPKFGGVMVWYVYTDHQSGYSAKIKDVNSAIQTAPSGVEVE
ncbi:acidic endochitinase-like [Vitis riparia]|uniref:acidic endochitinase-like n=1 Tax=Vitis riparia TaxID=96939 RepID=UPI00155A5990|nr:acidic endochitinase-like [Vitis riparia]